MASATEDLQSAKNSLANNDFRWATFQIQQSVEKALKAVLIKKENKLIKIHDLVSLSSMVNLPEESSEHCKQITQFYTINRYPDIPKINLTKESVEEYITWAKVIIEW